MIRVLIADDQALLRAGLSTLLGQANDMSVVGEATDGIEAVGMVERLAPDVVVMDVRMPAMDGIEATRRIMAGSAGSAVKVLMLTTFDVDEHIYDALRAGASGFLLKDAAPERLMDAVRVVASGDALLQPSVTRRLIDEFARRSPPADARSAQSLGHLTQRERQMLVLVARGLSNAEIADRESLSYATVKTHVSHLLSKLGMRDRAQLVVFAYENGVVTPGSV